MSSPRQVIEVVQFKKQPINPSSYQVFKVKEEDLNNIDMPIESIKLNNQIRLILQNCYVNHPKIPYAYLSSKLRQIISDEFSQASEILQVTEDFSKQSKLYSITFIGKLEVIKDSLLYMMIGDCPEVTDTCFLQLRNSRGELLLMIKGFKINEPDRRIIKRFEGIFKGGNIIIISNESKSKFSMDLSYFEQLCKSNNQFLYIQPALKIVTDYRSFDGDQTVFALNHLQFPQLPIYFIQTIRYGTIICSKSCLFMHISGSTNYHIEAHQQMRRFFEAQLNSINADVNFGCYSWLIKYCILNILILKESHKARLTFKEAIQYLIDFLSHYALKVSEKTADIEKRKRNAHFPAIMKHCKECRVCLKQYIEEKGVKTKKAKRSSRIQEHKIDKSNNPQTKIRKTKYCCEGCTVTYGKQIPICVLCFKEFHFNVPFYMGNEFKQGVYISQKNLSEKSSSQPAVKSEEKESIQSSGIGVTDSDSENKIALELMKSIKLFQQKFFTKLTRLQEQLQEKPPQQKQSFVFSKQDCSEYLEY